MKSSHVTLRSVPGISRIFALGGRIYSIDLLTRGNEALAIGLDTPARRAELCAPLKKPSLKALILEGDDLYEVPNIGHCRTLAARKAYQIALDSEKERTIDGVTVSPIAA